MEESNEIDSPPQLRTSRTGEAEDIDMVNGPRPRRQQGILAFSAGSLTIKKPIVNPIPRDHPSRKKLAEVAKETCIVLPGLLVTRPDVSNESFLYRKEPLGPARHPSLSYATIRVINLDTIDAALSLQGLSPEPVAVLNMANATRPGGGFHHGAKAQEEALCFRSSLIMSLLEGQRKKLYPIPEDAVLYSPTVLIIRDSMANGHALLDCRDPSQLDVISVISCPAIHDPPLKKAPGGLQTYRDKRDADLMKEKMRAILRTAIRNKHKQLVLGALGCGVFGNPNHVVAHLWSTVFQEVEFRGGYWKDVVFAVLGDNNPGSNFKVFHDVLDGLQV